MTDDYTLHHGSDGTTDYLLTTWADGSAQLSMRPAGSRGIWTAPVRLEVVP